MFLGLCLDLSFSAILKGGVGLSGALTNKSGSLVLTNKSGSLYLTRKVA